MNALLRWLAVIAVCLHTGVALAQSISIPLPTLPKPADGAVELRVVYVSNPRLPEMIDAQMQLLLNTAQQGMLEHFGLRVRFNQPDKLDIASLFQRFARGHIRRLGASIYDFKSGRGDAARLRKAYVEGLGRNKDDLAAQIDYVQPYLLGPLLSRTYEGLGDALMHTHLARLRQFRDQRMPDGAPLLDDTPYNEYMYWGSLDLIRLPYEVVITNQLIASAEYEDVEVHSAIRGGISNGITAQNGAARHWATSVVSAYPFIGSDETTRELRGKESYPPEVAARYAGYLLVHELGHQLLHLGHPYGRRACVMNPVELLHFRLWVTRFSAKDCPMASSGAMAPGFIKMPLPQGVKP